ncbi:MAG: DUF2459 domain-containing protein [Kiloniellales bacterium]|nr:DUF2459 domain-containing protein [Kiloniellales bacterium]
MCCLKGLRALRLFLLSAVLLTAACRSDPVVTNPSQAGPEEARISVYVSSNGWHSAIVLPRAALPEGAIPEAADFPAAAYLSFGWGDATYFPAREPTTAMALSAALRPSPAVLHLAGLTAPPGEVFPADEVVELRTTPEGLAALVAFLDATFERDGAERVEAREPGLYPFSLFYPATGEFHLFNTCNTWTARGLRAGGWPVRATGTVTAEELMVQVRPLASAED